MFTTILLTLAFFSACFLLMGIGFLIRGMVLKSSCGGTAAILGEGESCGVCAKKANDLCPSDDEGGLVRASLISNPHKTLRERHQDPGLSV